MPSTAGIRTPGGVLLARRSSLFLPKFTRRDVEFRWFFGVTDTFFRFLELTIFLLRRSVAPLRFVLGTRSDAVWGADAIPVFNAVLAGFWGKPVAHVSK